MKSCDDGYPSCRHAEATGKWCDVCLCRGDNNQFLSNFMFWKNAGQPAIKSPVEQVQGHCACCGAEMNAGVAVTAVIGTAITRQHELMPHGSHVCQGCAWMCEDSKQKNRNVLAVGADIYWPMIGAESATAERPSWFSLLSTIAAHDPAMPVMGVLTTDPKPRLWPLAQQCTIADFGLYVHCPDYDVSEFMRFGLHECLEIAAAVSAMLTAGYSKRACYFGLLSDMKKARKSPAEAIASERELAGCRKSPAFTPALLIASKPT